jgi:hypothetical protein
VRGSVHFIVQAYNNYKEIQEQIELGGLFNWHSNSNLYTQIVKNHQTVLRRLNKDGREIEQVTEFYRVSVLYQVILVTSTELNSILKGHRYNIIYKHVSQILAYMYGILIHISEHKGDFNFQRTIDNDRFRRNACHKFDRTWHRNKT